MDPENIDRMFAKLRDETLPIGGSFVSPEGNVMIPFLCEAHPFVALYQPVAANDELFQSTANTVMADANHQLSSNAYLMKFAAMPQWASGNLYAPLDGEPAIKQIIRHRIPQRLAKVTEHFLTEAPDADELYFIPGGDGERTRYLNSWYSRVSDRYAVDQLGLSRIHLNHGNFWYGYRKA